MSQGSAKKSVSGANDPRHLTVAESANGKPAEVGDQSLLGTIGLMAESLQIMRDIIQKADFIAVNASIEAARTQTQSENFTLVADQVRRQAERTEELAQSLGGEIGDLETYALRASAVRFADIASDMIDKVDRNLFERNCDAQAWAGFDENRRCAEATKDMSSKEVVNAFASKGNAKEGKASASHAIASACERLGQLCGTYQVYADVFALNNKGVIVAAASNQALVGEDQSDREFFRTVMEKGEVHVTDMYHSRSVKTHTVAYSAPIKDADGNVMGVLTTRFNWKYVQEMIDKMPGDKETALYVINGEGTLLSSKTRRCVLQDNLSWLMAGESALQGKSGFTIECARNGQLSAWGYCHTYGFGAYPGKGWSAIVSHPVRSKARDFFDQSIARDGEANRRAADEANADLERVTANIRERVKSINAINNETNMLAVNAAIQAGVAGAEGESFSVIASEIGKLAKQSEDFVNGINSLTETLGTSVRSTVFTRLGEAAFDTIDKIDRNLFERYCDVQAFASFSSIRGFLESRQNPEAIQDLLLRLFEIYEVYHDVYLLDADGVIVSAAKHRELIGSSQRDRDWFREASSGKLVVTDLYYSNSINDYTVTFAAPVVNAQKKLMGVMTTRFNCKFIYDIMKATIVGRGSQVYLINSKGTIIGSPSGEGILKDSLTHLKAFRSLDSAEYGFVTERSEDGKSYSVGFAKTQGYLSYKGKGWSVLIMRDLADKPQDHRPARLVGLVNSGASVGADKSRKGGE